MDAIQDAVTRPLPKIVVDGGARWKILRQLAPLTAGAQHIADRIHHIAHVGFALAPALARRRDRRLDERPFRVRQIAWITPTARLLQLKPIPFPHCNLPTPSVSTYKITFQSFDPTTFRTGSEQSTQPDVLIHVNTQTPMMRDIYQPN